MVRFITIGGCLLVLVFGATACGARSEEQVPPTVTTANNPTAATPGPEPQIAPSTEEKATALVATPPSLPGAGSGGGSPVPEVKPAQDSTGVVKEPDGDAVAGPTTEQEALLASLPDGGEAPELENEVWLNSPPLRLTELRGKVVLLDMWTFG